MAKSKKTVAKKSAKKPAKKASAAKKTVVKKTAAKKAAKGKAAPKKVVNKKTKIDLSRVVTPLDDRVLVQLVEKETMTAGGLYIPDTVSDVSGNLEGFVISVGRGHRNKKGYVRPMDLKVGDKVLFSEYAGSKIKIQDQDLLIVREIDVLGVIA
ncbi:MAG TPA: co-chaperone GroES [Pseudobdellovibrionaceae bacterium]